MFLYYLSAGLATSVCDRTHVTYGVIRDQVVNVMATLPPTNGQSAAKVRDEYPDHHVNVEVMSNGKVPCIVRYEHNLMPEKAQKYS